MKKSLLLAGALLLGNAYAQTTLFQDNFESGSGNWTLNGGTGNNQWVVNSEYVDNSGFNFVADTPDEPAAVTNSPNSAYLHIYNVPACGYGICNAAFDTGSSSSQSAMQTASVSTTGYTGVTLSFYYLCDGASGVSYGTIDYSTDNGSTWTTTGVNYSSVSTWTLATISLAGFDNQAQLKFRFNWTNGSSGNDPAFSVDELKIVGTPSSSGSAAVATGTMSSNHYCSNVSTAISIPFTVTGTVNSGNIYTAELSSSTGSFTSPSTIGTLTSSSTGSLSISGNIPAGLAVGNQYRIRVMASDPATTGTDNGVDISVTAPPTVSVVSVPTDGHICQGASAGMSASGGSTFVWSPAASLDNANNQNVVANPTQTTTYTVVGTDASGCSDSTTYTITVDSCLSVTEQEMINWNVYPNPVNTILTVDFPETISLIEILDNSGRVVYQSKTIEPIQTAGFTNGVYTVRVSATSGIYHRQIVKQ